MIIFFIVLPRGNIKVVFPLSSLLINYIWYIYQTLLEQKNLGHTVHIWKCIWNLKTCGSYRLRIEMSPFAQYSMELEISSRMTNHLRHLLIHRYELTRTIKGWLQMVQYIIFFKAQQMSMCMEIGDVLVPFSNSKSYVRVVCLLFHLLVSKYFSNNRETSNPRCWKHVNRLIFVVEIRLLTTSLSFTHFFFFFFLLFSICQWPMIK